MQCPICKFQNMPDEEICTNCKALLKAYGIPAFPPRTKRFKHILNSLNKIRMLFDSYSPVFEIEAEEKKAREPIDIIGTIKFILNPENPAQFWRRNRWIAAILSVIPGLGHLFLRQFRTALFFFLSFIIFILLYIVVPDTFFCILLRGGIIGTMLISILTASPIDFLIPRTPSNRLVTALFLYIIIFVFIIRPITINHLDFICIDSLHNPALEVNLKHRKLILNHLFFDVSKIKHGDIVIYDQSADVVRQWMWIRSGRNAFEKVIGLPGEMVEIKDKKIYVNGIEIEMDKYPLTYTEQSILPSIKVELDATHCFIFPEIINYHAPREVLEQTINRACKLSLDQIKGKGIPYM